MRARFSTADVLTYMLSSIREVWVVIALMQHLVRHTIVKKNLLDFNQLHNLHVKRKKGSVNAASRFVAGWFFV